MAPIRRSTIVNDYCQPAQLRNNQQHDDILIRILQIVNDYCQPAQLRNNQQHDDILIRILQWKKEGRRPGWQEVAPGSRTLKSYWAKKEGRRPGWQEVAPGSRTLKSYWAQWDCTWFTNLEVILGTMGLPGCGRWSIKARIGGTRRRTSTNAVNCSSVSSTRCTQGAPAYWRNKAEDLNERS
ncbi:hypothetical protein QE152_g24837 [Popillia japonica]|uniref:Uncharacterized protein n=1 Tax=Popillia japonica TaxID=7064 RepID=A0AAW1K3K0_POPJA